MGGFSNSGLSGLVQGLAVLGGALAVGGVGKPGDGGKVEPVKRPAKSPETREEKQKQQDGREKKKTIAVQQPKQTSVTKVLKSLVR
jgi:hypothetical protein